jgi:hypothetical protein
MVSSVCTIMESQSPTVSKVLFLHPHPKQMPNKRGVDKRKMLHDMSGCIMCRQSMEFALHSFFLGTYAISVWFLLQRKYQMEFIRPDLTITLILQNDFDRTRGKPAQTRSLWSRVVMATCWQPWKQRNTYIFGDTPSSSVVPPSILVQRICEDVEL